MTAVIELTFPRTELAVREQNGMSVTLLWARGTDVLAVAVVDLWSGESFEYVLEPHERPLDVFYHPYAYAASRGLDVGCTPRREEETVDV
jgi:hypothetical protein